jgi:hypothetical protein
MCRRLILPRQPGTDDPRPAKSAAAPQPLSVVLLFALAGIAFWLIYGLSVHFLFADRPKLPCLWDCIWYASIVHHGYDLVALPNGFANWAFFPAFPALSCGVARPLGLSPQLAVIATSTLCYAAAALALRSYLLEFAGPEASRIGVILFVFSAYAVYGFSGYAEPLYFLLMIMAFWCLRGRRWVLAGVIGALLSATRPTGILLIPVFLIAGLRWRIDRSPRRELVAFLVGLALVPFGLLAFTVLLHLQVGDALAFIHVQTAWARQLSNPMTVLLIGFRGFGFHPIAPFLSIAAVIGLAMAVYLIVRRFYEEGISLLAHVFMSLSTGLVSLPRHIAWQMPFLFGLTLICSRSRITERSVLIFSIIMFVFMAVAWASGAMFVV